MTLESGIFFRNFLTGFDAGATRQADIHHHHIGLEGFDLLDGFVRRTGLRNHLEIRVAFEQRFQAQTDNLVIINQ